MAISNRDWVGRGFELLAAGLAPYVERRMGASTGAAIDWREPGSSLQDPSFLLRVMVQAWDRSFASELTKTDRNLVFELRDVRNRWAHNASFSADDAYRALDSLERLLTAADAHEATEVGRAKKELMRQQFEAQARKATPSADAL
ncbi:MAG: Swt1 family HEPN domain-containing protein [Actinomycetota bacterium]|nr:Swt1 family HEPN domain-containing protein [Actinomycetota bacterium]